MNRIIVVTIWAVFGTTCFGQSPEASAPSGTNYEEFPELKASEILKPEYLKGSHYTVRENVATGSGVNQFVIDSDFGVFDADGDAMLVRREKEIYAIADLMDVSKTDQFKDSLTNAAKGTFNAAKKIVTDPGETLSNVPKGISKFMGKAGNSIKNIGKKKDDDNQGDSTAEKMTDVAKSKRRIAVSMGIDPYSTNSVLQKQLENVAWASWAGGFAFSAATFPISGPVGAGLTVTNVSDSLNKVVAEQPPTNLKAMNRENLRKAGASSGDTERLLNNNAFTLTDETALALNLKALDGVANRGAFVRAAADKSDSESDALFCVQTSALMGQLHTTGHPLAHIVMIGDLPACVAKDGTLIVALQWDYAAWTPRAAELVDELQKMANEPGYNKHILVAISGQMSPRFKQELQTRGIAAQDRMNPGPLK